MRPSRRVLAGVAIVGVVVGLRLWSALDVAEPDVVVQPDPAFGASVDPCSLEAVDPDWSPRLAAAVLSAVCLGAGQSSPLPAPDDVTAACGLDLALDPAPADVAPAVLRRGCSTFARAASTPPELGSSPSSEAYLWEACSLDPSRSGGRPVKTFGAVDPVTGHAMFEQLTTNGFGAAELGVFWTAGPSVWAWRPLTGERDWTGVESTLGGVPAVDLDPLRTPEGVVAQFAIDGVEPEPLVDRDGRTFQRYEVLPTTFAYVPDHAVRPVGSVLLHPVTDLVWALDLWIDDVGRTERIRLMTDAPGPRWAELRFIAGPGVEDALRPALDCPTELGTATGPWMGHESWDQTLRAPLKVSVDQAGRPYDTELQPGWTTAVEEVGVLVVPDGELRVVDGNAIEVDPAYFADEATAIDFGETVAVDLSFVRQSDGEPGPILGVRLDVPGTVVDRWSRFEPAYGTDGGVGGVTTRRLIELASSFGDDIDPTWHVNPAVVAVTEEWVLVPDGPDHFLGDLDPTPGDDTLVFHNGWGDGAFPLSRGFDVGGELVSVLIWDVRHPWRPAVPDGTPPPDVTEREQELQECLDGERDIDAYGNCVGD